MNTIFFLENDAINTIGLIDFFASLAIIIVFDYIVFSIVKRNLPIIFISIFSVLFLTATILDLDSVRLILITGIIAISIVSLIANLASIRSVVANIYTGPKKIGGHKKNAEDIKLETSEAYKIINESVLYLSKHKIGALITFERKDNLDSVLKNGSSLLCPINYELLITIFYPGTRLHDGAVVIRDNKIIAASVYYTPTTKPLVGKYGSRHRAAIGISEICDAVTIVVSEETGKISIAYDGELATYHPDNFYKAFENIMSETSIEGNRNEK